MKLRSLAVQNFMAFGPRQKLALGGLGLVLVEGENLDDPKARSNGAGKSSLLEALVWGLYGQTLRGVTGDAVINRRVGKEALVELQLSSHGHRLVVRRGRKLGGKPSVLEFDVDGQDETQSTQKDTQERLENYLGAPYEVFINSVVFGQGSKWRFSELNDAGRKEVLDQILRVGALASAQDHVRSKRDLADARLQTLTAQLDVLKAEIQLTRRYIQEAKEQAADDTKNALKRLLARQKLLDRQIDENTATYLKGVASLRVEAVEVESKRDKLNTVTLVARQQRLAKARDDLAKVKALLVAARTSISEVRAQISEVNAMRGDCMTCGAAITPDGRKAYAKTLRFYETEHLRNLPVLEAEESRAKAAVIEWQEKVEKLQAQDQALSRELVKILGKEREFQRFKDASAVATAERNHIAEEISTLKAKAKKGDTALARLRKRLADMKAEQVQVRGQVSVVRDDLEYYEFWLRGFGNQGVKSYLFDYVAPILNQRAAEYARQLSSGLTVEFLPQKATKAGELRDKLDVRVTNEHGADTYAGNSGGEKRKADIIIARALQSLQEDRVKAACNVSWWDEVFESLDEAGCEAVMRVLREEAEKRSSVFVITHQEWLKAHFPQVVRVVKEDGFARIEM